MAEPAPQFHQELAEKLAREPQVGGGVPARLLMFSVTIFVIVLLIYFGMLLGYEPYLQTQLNKVNNQIDVFSKQISADDQAQLVNFYSQLSNVQYILANHLRASKFFKALESTTEVNVYFNRLNFTAFNNQAQLSGVTKSVDDLVNQLAIWQANSAIQRVDLSQISYNPQTQGFTFNATLYLADNFLTSVQ